jgi:CubicO group peptidase (beta-lactamase class C family)
MYEQPALVDTIYDIASLSKIVGTLSCIQKLYDSKILEVDDLVSKFIP